MKKCKGYWSSFMIHSSKCGIYKDLYINKKIKSKIIEFNLFVKPGHKVKKYNNAQQILGNIILKFNNQKEMLDIYSDPEKYIKVNLV